MISDEDLASFRAGTHPKLWQVLGAHVVVDGRRPSGRSGVSFAVWAPRARNVAVVGDFNAWNAAADPMVRRDPWGVWEIGITQAAPGQRYKFAVTGVDGVTTLRADPMARAAELPPASASVIEASTFDWSDDAWVSARRESSPTEGRMSIYEVHLGSWRHPADGPVRYEVVAEELATYVVEMGFTHVELMPVAEHPYGGSWGYQVTGYYASTSRFGPPDGFRTFVDTMHRHGIGVIVDWVPAHFPRDPWALVAFDGANLYEPEDPDMAAHPDWGTLVFDLARPEVRNFLVANASFWFDEFHIDGLRVDAVASMLYLDYSRGDGAWTPNVHGGNEDLETVSFLREVNTVVRDAFPGVLMVAEESTTWPGVSAAVADGGLGFTHKWNMGWMHDTLAGFERDPADRSDVYNQLTFGFTYAWSERFVLPLSHDEVVHEKRSLLEKMPGEGTGAFANLCALYGWMWAHPGPQLLFMGGEIAQRREWADDRRLDWELLDDPHHRAVSDLVAQLNAVQETEAALFRDDFTPAGFGWVCGDDPANTVLAFLRHDPSGASRSVLCVASLGGRALPGHRIGVPLAGQWELIMDSNATLTGRHPALCVDAEPVGWHGQVHSIVVDLPPVGVWWLAPRSSVDPAT